MHHNRNQGVVHGSEMFIAVIVQARADASSEEPSVFDDECGPLAGAAAMDAIYAEAADEQWYVHGTTGKGDIEGERERSND